MEEAASKPSDVGFGYISNEPVEQHVTIKSDVNGLAGAPLKSALKTPGTPGRLLNPLSPTFREEQILEKQEEKTDIDQAKDLVWSISLSEATHLLIFFDRKSRPESAWPRWFYVESTSPAHSSSSQC
jgi:hypothetical protein